jgi:drug/metabolite transporter (DMT)-like permease
MQKSTLRAHFFLLAANVIYGINFSVAKLVMPQYIQPSGFILLRCLGAVLLFWITGLFIPDKKVENKDIGFFALSAIFGIAVNQLLFFEGLNRTSPINGGIIMVATPVLVLIMASFIRGERITGLKILGIALGLIGALSLLLFKSDFSFGSVTMAGDLMILANATSYAIYIVMIKPKMQTYHPITVMRWVFLFGTIYVIPFGYNQFTAIPWNTMPASILWATAFVVIGTTFFAYLLNTMALAHLSASVVGIYIYLQPLLASAFAMLVGQDTPTIQKAISALLIFSGVFLVSKK